MSAPGSFSQGVFQDGATLALSDVMVAYRPGQLPGWSTYTVAQLGAVVPTSTVVGTGPFLNAGTVHNGGTIAQAALSANFAVGATIDLAGTIVGARTFSGAVTMSAAGTALSITNGASVGGLANLGTIQVGAASFTANDVVATVLTGVGPVGANTTVQEWFTLKNSGGVTRYLPAF